MSSRVCDWVIKGLGMSSRVCDWVIKGLGMSSHVCVTKHIHIPISLVEKSRASCPGGRSLLYRTFSEELVMA